jgi:hypothetical protein
MRGQRAGHATERIAAELLDALPEVSALEAWRLALGWSRAQVVEQVAKVYIGEGLRPPGLSEAMLCRYEHGQERPGVEYAGVLAGVYGTTRQMLGLVGRCGCGGVRPETLEHPSAVTACYGADTLRGGRYDDEGTEPMRRRTLLTAAGLSIPLSLLQRLDDALAAPPQPDHPAEPAQIAHMLRAARQQFDASELAALIATLPGLLASSREAAERADTPTGWALVSASYNLATDTLNKVGNKPSARITADRSMLYADRSQDPVAKAAAARALGMMLRTQGRPDLATAVMSRGVDQLAATGLATTAQAAMYLRLLCARAYTYAWAGDRSRALEGIAEAEHAAARIPAMTPTSAPFATLYRVDIHYALGDGGTALHAARDLRDGMFPTPERRGRLHTDLARAWWQWGKPEQATAELLTAYQHAPAEVRDRPSIRKIAAEVVERHPKVAGVRQLATSISRPRSMSTAGGIHQTPP